MESIQSPIKYPLLFVIFVLERLTLVPYVIGNMITSSIASMRNMFLSMQDTDSILGEIVLAYGVVGLIAIATVAYAILFPLAMHYAAAFMATHTPALYAR